MIRMAALSAFLVRMGAADFIRAIAALFVFRVHMVGLTVGAVVVALTQLAEPVLFGRIVDALSRGEGVTSLIVAWVALGFLGIATAAVAAVAADRIAHRLRLTTMAQAFERAITLPVDYHSARGSGAVVRVILAGSDALFFFWLALLREQLASLVGLICLLPLALTMDARLAVVLAICAAIFMVLNIVVTGRTSAKQQVVEKYHDDVFRRIGDVIGNVTVVQSYSRFAAELGAVKETMGRLLQEQYPVLTWWGVLTILTRAAGTISMAVIFVVGAVLADRGEISVGEIVSFIAFAGLLIVKLEQISAFVVRAAQQTPTFTALFSLLDQRAAVADSPGAIAPAQILGRVSYENVTFRYQGTDHGVAALSFAAAAGETLALVGPTGSGKSTTLALLQRLHTPSGGRITIDGHDIRDLSLTTLRRAIAVVFQDAGLFNRSIAENIRVGRPEASDSEVELAARAAEAHDFILQKPGGYSFVIGENGLSLSGGERQRIAIARAILKDAPILILDEATSSLDAETEARIKRALDALRRGKTTFIIAHRLSTVVNADHILVLQQGAMVERGTYSQLLEANGTFAHLVAAGGFTRPVGRDP